MVVVLCAVCGCRPANVEIALTVCDSCSGRAPVGPTGGV